MLGEVRDEELDAYRSLFELVERRATCSTCSPRRSTRAGRSSASATSSRNPALREIALVGARTGSSTGRSAPSASSARRGWTTRRRSGACARPPRAVAVRRVDLRGQSRSTRFGAQAPSLHSELMATTERDYYELLGVERTASEAEIKKAFRALARELHPDVSEEPDAEERFSEVVEAYEVLSKSETRELYDRFGHAGLRSGGFSPTSVDFGIARRPLLGLLRRRSVRRSAPGRGVRRVAPTSPPRSRSSWSRPPAVSGETFPSRSRSPARPATGRRGARARSRSRARPAAAAAGSSRSRRRCSASSSARRPAGVRRRRPA